VFDTREEAEQKAKDILLVRGFEYSCTRTPLQTVWQDHGPPELKVVVQRVPYGY